MYGICGTLKLLKPYFLFIFQGPDDNQEADKIENDFFSQAVL